MVFSCSPLRAAVGDLLVIHGVISNVNVNRPQAVKHGSARHFEAIYSRFGNLFLFVRSGAFCSPTSARLSIQHLFVLIWSLDAKPLAKRRNVPEVFVF